LTTPGKRGGDVDLAEPAEELVVAAEDLHQPSPFVGDHLQGLDFHAVDHRFSLRSDVLAVT